MKLFLISQSENRDYDTFSDAVVCAPDEDTARNMNPDGGLPMTQKDWSDPCAYWCSSPEKVKVQYIGEAAESVKQGVVCASFHAG